MKRIGIVGCGLIADTHVESIRAAMPDAEIVLADPQPGKAELLSRKYNLGKSYTDMDAMLAEAKPFAVHLCSPPHWHIRQARQCIAAGCHVLIEKPLCFSEAEATALYETARQAGVSVTVDHSLLFQPSVLRMKDHLQKNGDPPVLQLDTFYGLDVLDDTGVPPADHWKHLLPGGNAMDSLVHPISLAIEMAGSPREIVLSRTGSPEQEQVKVMWNTGTAVVSLAVSRGAQPFRRSTQVVTSSSTFFVDHSSEVLAILGSGSGPRALRKLFTNLRLGTQLLCGTAGTVWRVARKKLKQNPGARALIAAFYEHLIKGAPNPTSEKNVLDVTRVLEQIAAQLGKSENESAKAASPAARQPKKKARTLTTLVTGASGFLGRALCEDLARSGTRHIIAQVRRGANADRLAFSPDIEKRYLDFDYLTPDDFAHLLEGVDEVVHCAHAAGAKIWVDYERRNVTHALALYEAATAAGCRRFVNISSLAVYGVRARGSQPLDEGVAISDGDARYDFYIRSKARAETALQKRAAEGGIPLLILRPGILYAAGGERLLGKSIPLSNGRLFICMGRGRNRLPFTRVDRLADLITHALEMSPFPEGVFNISGRQTEDFKTFLGARCATLGIGCRFLHLPAMPMRMGAMILELLHALLGRKRPPKLTRYVVDSATRDLVYDCTKAKEVLGWDADAAVRETP